MYGAFWHSAEKRAELKAARAVRKASSGNKKAAARLHKRSAILKAKASGDAVLGANSDYTSLWDNAYPYAKRRRMGGSGLLGAAKGYRPVGAQVKSEQRAVILGGIMALKAAGDEAASAVNVEALPQKMIQSDEQDAALIRAAQRVTGKKFSGSLLRASEAVRAAVKKQNLQEVAWPVRALFMLNASNKRSGVTSASASAVSAATGIAAGAVAGSGAAPPWIQNIVTAPAAGILGLVSLAASGVGTGAATKQAMAKGAAQSYEQAVAANLEKWSVQQQRQVAREQVNQLQLAKQQVELQVQQEAAASSERMIKAAKVLAWSGGAAVGLGLLYYIAIRRRES